MRIGEGVVKVALLLGMWGLRVVVAELGEEWVEKVIAGGVLCMGDSDVIPRHRDSSREFLLPIG